MVARHRSVIRCLRGPSDCDNILSGAQGSFRLRKNPLSNISTQGGIITSEFLQNFRKETVNNPGVMPESFSTFGGGPPPNKHELDKHISDAWDELRERWDSVSHRYSKMDLAEARSKWIIPLLKALGFDPTYNKQDIKISESEELSSDYPTKAGMTVRPPCFIQSLLDKT